MKILPVVILISIGLAGCASTQDNLKNKDLYFTPSTASNPQVDPIINPNEYQVTQVGKVIHVPLSQKQIRATFDDDGNGVPHTVREYIYTQYKDVPNSNDLIISMENYISIRSNILKMVAQGQDMKKHIKLFYYAVDNRVCLTKKIKKNLDLNDVQANKEVTALHDVFLKDDVRLKLYIIMNQQLNHRKLNYNYKHVNCGQFENK